MLRPAKRDSRRGPARPADAGSVRLHLAMALIGQSVDLLASATTIVHGVVSGVLTDSGSPQVVVGGSPYDLNQILTVTPTALN